MVPNLLEISKLSAGENFHESNSLALRGMHCACSGMCDGDAWLSKFYNCITAAGRCCQGRHHLLLEWVAKHSKHVASCSGLYCTNRTRYDELNASIDTLIYRGNASFMRISSVQFHAVGFSENYSEKKKVRHIDIATLRIAERTKNRGNMEALSNLSIQCGTSWGAPG